MENNTRGPAAAEPSGNGEAKPAASYGRKSDDDQQGIAAQHLGNEQRARADGYVIPPGPEYRYEDDDTTGVSKSRRGWDRLLNLVVSGEAPFTRIYIKDKTRLGRWSDPRYAFFLEVLCEQHSVQIVYSENERHIDFSSEDPDPAMVGYFLKEAADGVVASQERRRLISRVTEGMRARVWSRYFPGALASYGLERWLADETTGELLERVERGAAVRRSGCLYKLSWSEDGSRAIIREIYEGIAAGKSLRRIAAELNARGVLPPSGKGLWSAEAVRRIARNPIYCGDLVWGRTTRQGEPAEGSAATLKGKEPMLMRDYLADPPVTRELWEEAQSILNGNRSAWTQRRATAPEYLLSGLITCEQCGAGWHGFTSSKAARTRRRYYRHAKVRSTDAACACQNRYLRAESLEDAVRDVVGEVLQDGRLEALVSEVLEERSAMASSKDREREIARTKKRIARAESTLDRLVRDRTAANSDAEYQACNRQVQRLSGEVNQLAEQLAALTAEQTQLEALAQKESHIARRARDLRLLIEGCDPHAQKEVIAAVVEGIRIEPTLTRATVAVRAL